MKQKLLALIALVLSTSGGSCALTAIDAEIFRLETLETNKARSAHSDLLVASYVSERI